VTAYCAVNDLLLGQIPAPVGIDKQKVVDDAADEIDSKIGMLYETPIDIVSDPTVPPRPVKLLLKRLNVFLATGRLILAAASNMEDQQLHAYGLSLVSEATTALAVIASGEMVLDGVDPAEGYTPHSSTPLINNLDPESSVEAFYNRIANPSYLYSSAETVYAARYGNEQGMVR
jgi:hypothetical protein